MGDLNIYNFSSMVLIVYFTDKNRPEEYINIPDRGIMLKKGETYKTQNDYGIVVKSGFENRGGQLMKFLEVKIEKEEPWVELKGTPEKNGWTDFVEKEKNEKGHYKNLAEFLKVPKKTKKVKPSVHPREYLRRQDDLWFIPPSKEMAKNVSRLQEKIDSQPDYSNDGMPETPNFHMDAQN